MNQESLDSSSREEPAALPRLKAAQASACGQMNPAQLLDYSRVSWLAQQDVSLSWHLTQAEKSTIAASLYTPANRETLQRIVALLSPRQPPKKEEAGPSGK